MPYGYPTFDVYFESYWNNTEPEDGAYTISTDIAFPENDPYTVFIACNYEDIYFESQPGTVYVTHVNGKLQVTFCNLTLTGNFGNDNYSTTAEGNIDAP